MNLLKLKRKDARQTQLQLARQINVPLRTYTRYEAELHSSEYHEPKISVALKIADALGVQDLRELWDYQGEKI